MLKTRVSLLVRNYEKRRLGVKGLRGVKHLIGHCSLLIGCQYTILSKRGPSFQSRVRGKRGIGRQPRLKEKVCCKGKN